VRGRFCSALAVAGLLACGGKNERASSRPPAVPPDSLALRLPDGTSIWFTAARSDRDSAGQTCVERVIEIRRDTLRIAVPLLYTAAAPSPVDDSTIAAELWLHCRPGDRYLVDLRTGRPRRVAR
jgi:hypothetical protein